MSVYGSKCANWSDVDIVPETLGSIYRELRIQLDDDTKPFKPKPGDQYRKAYKPLTRVDMKAFREMPSDITIVSPPRLLRSRAWKYHGQFFLECDCNWEFQYKFIWSDKYRFEWFPIRILSTCYIFNTCTFPTPIPKPIQLTLF